MLILAVLLLSTVKVIDMKDITEDYIDFFQGKEPIPIYKVDESKLGWSNKLLVWYRKRFFGVEGGAEFRSFGVQPQIRISSNVRDNVFDEVVRHEVNHYVYEDKDDWDMLKLTVLPLTGVVLHNIGSYTSLNWLRPVGVWMVAAFLPLFIYLHVVWFENRANQDVDIDTKKFSWRDEPKKAFLNAFLPFVAFLAVPLNLFTFLEQVWLRFSKSQDL